MQKDTYPFSLADEGGQASISAAANKLKNNPSISGETGQLSLYRMSRIQSHLNVSNIAADLPFGNVHRSDWLPVHYLSKPNG